MHAVVVTAQPVTYGYGGGDQVQDWPTELCEVRDCGACCCAWFFPCCALGEIRSTLDGSNYCVNCCCVSTPAMRWLVRTAYNIQGNAHYDCWTGCFCPCCSISQMLQTVRAKGRPPIPNVGPEFNLNVRNGFIARPTAGVFYDACYALLCGPCAIGLMMQNAGMPCWFGSLCVNPFSANSILRYHNRIHPMADSDFWPDCCIPSACAVLTSYTGGISGPLAGWCYVFGNLVEENARAGRSDCCYGCDLFGCIGGFCSWCFTCSCSAPEGRYLVKGIPVN